MVFCQMLHFRKDSLILIGRKYGIFCSSDTLAISAIVVTFFATANPAIVETFPVSITTIRVPWTYDYLGAI